MGKMCSPYFEIVLVILLTNATSCALIPKIGQSEDDPIARVALREYNKSHEHEREQEGASRSRIQDEMIQRALASDRLAVGMRMEEVRSIWGQPREIETAGEVGSGNQKWVYPDGVSSQWDIKPSRVVYFEGGQVTGWEAPGP